MSTRPTFSEGFVLVTSLVILMILTMLTLSSVQGTGIQELISRNHRDSNLAFQRRETALVKAEATIEAMEAVVYGVNVTPKIYDARATGPLLSTADFSWMSTAGYVNRLSGPEVDSVVATPPGFIIENVRTVISAEDRLNIDNIGQNPNTCCTQMFRITARGTGGTDVTQVIIQATYGKQF